MSGTINDEPQTLPERCADAAMDAAKALAEKEGTELEDCLILVRVKAGTPDCATAAFGDQYEGDGAGAALAAELLSRAGVVLNAMGKDIQIVPLGPDTPMGGGAMGGSQN